MYNFAALQKERKNNVTTKVSESEKKPIDTYETHCENARERPTRNAIGTPYYIYRHKGPYVKGKILIY